MKSNENKVAGGIDATQTLHRESEVVHVPGIDNPGKFAEGSKVVLQVAEVEKGEVGWPIMDSEKVAEESKYDNHVTIIVNLERLADEIKVEDASLIVDADKLTDEGIEETITESFEQIAADTILMMSNDCDLLTISDRDIIDLVQPSTQLSYELGSKENLPRKEEVLFVHPFWVVRL